MYSHKLLLGGGALLGLTLLSGAILTAPKASADTSGTVDITVAVPTACSLSATNNTLTKTINPGTSDTIGTSNIKALCNDANGFAIYAVGYTDDTYGNTDLITDLGTDYSIHTGTGTSTSNWNMTIDNDDVAGDHVATIENDFDQDSTIPDTYTKIASFASATDQSIGSNLTAQFDAYIASNQAAGTYQGKVKFVLVHPSDASAPSEENSLDASFAAANKAKINGYYSMADITPEICSGAYINEEGMLIDPRDNTVYTVARLSDGKCWMTQNMRLDVGNANITADNTNNPTAGFIAEAQQATSYSGMWESPTCAEYDWANCNDEVRYTTMNLGNGTIGYDGNTYDEYGVYYNWYTATAGHGTLSMSSGNTSGDLCPRGWHLPTGGLSGDFANLSVALGGLSTDMNYATDPTASETIEKLTSAPESFLLSGMAFDADYENDDEDETLETTDYYRGYEGFYFSSTAADMHSMYGMAISPWRLGGMIAISSPGWKYEGLPIRCVSNVE